MALIIRKRVGAITDCICFVCKMCIRWC